MEKIIDKINEERENLIEISLNIHENPELAFEEFYASKLLCDYLKGQGFKIRKDIATIDAALDTAFIAEYSSDKPGPTISYIAEYDALPGIGHGCGHNLIATMSTGAAVGLKAVIDEIGGRVQVIGTPAEEGGGGKIIMCRQGVFDDVDYALMIHPATKNLICRGGLATRSIMIEYHGKSAHSASPEKGINSLSAVIQTFNLIDVSRTLMPTGVNINGMILSGGKATNVIPDYASCKFSIRAVDIFDLKKIVKIIEKVVASVDELIGTKSKISLGMVYSERYPNKPIAETLKKHMDVLGEKMNLAGNKMKLGSSDIGNVSLIVPVIHSYIKIADEDVFAHTIEFTNASKSDYALSQMIKSSKALALTGFDILTNEILRKNIKTFFELNVPKYKNADLI